MSVKNDNTKLFFPVPAGRGNIWEAFIGTGYPCGHRHGVGFLRTWGTGKEDRPVCGGSGKLDAVVTIECKPSDKHQE